MAGRADREQHEEQGAAGERADDPIGPFHEAWHLIASTGAVAGALALGLGRVRARDPEAALAPAAAG